MAAYCRVDDLVTCELTACIPGSALGPTLVNKYGKPFLLPHAYNSCLLLMSMLQMPPYCISNMVKNQLFSPVLELPGGRGDFRPLRLWTRRQILGASVSSPTAFFLVRPLV